METGRRTCVGIIKPELYSASLKSICRRNEWDLKRLKAEVDATPKPKSGSEPGDNGYSPCISWEKKDVLFTSAESVRNLGYNTAIGSDTESIVSKKGTNTFCYLCNSMEEHASHHQKTFPRKPPKPRIEYLAPPPIMKRKKVVKPVILVHEALYKIEVFTADVLNASTDAQVFITIEGSEDILPKIKLHKNFGCSKFSFRRGTSETFYIKGPMLGNLETVIIEHDGVEEKHSWCLEKIEITHMASTDSWVFLCNKWLSLHIKDFKIKRQLKASPKQVTKADYKIIVHTGKKAFAGTDANVFITLYGEKRNSPKILLKDPTEKCFEKGRVDSFQVSLGELGKIQKIRIAHDGKGMAPGWFLDHVVLYNTATPSRKFYCYCNSWLSRDEGDGRLWKELPARNKPRTKGSPHDDDRIKYEIKVETGDVKYGGTDANVFIQIFGTGGVTPEIPLDDAKNNFERNMDDNFTVKADDVGKVEKILIGHDNSGVGAGWFLEKVTVRRYPQRVNPKQKKQKDRNVSDRRKSQSLSRSQSTLKGKHKDLQDLVNSDSMGYQERNLLAELLADSELIRREKWAIPEVRRSSDGEASDWSESDNSDGYVWSRNDRPRSSYRRHGTDAGRSARRPSSLDSRRRSLRNTERRQRDKDSQSESDTDYVESRPKSDYKTVLYEEYVFVCHQWLSSDEGDRQIVRELRYEQKYEHFDE